MFPMYILDCAYKSSNSLAIETDLHFRLELVMASMVDVSNESKTREYER
jgi:hypothetical protein